MPRTKEKEKMNIVIVVSLDGSLKRDFKIVTAHTVGSRVRLTTWGSGRKDGTIYIPIRVLRKMFENSGKKVTEENMVNGNKRQLKELEERNKNRNNKEQND